MSAVAGQDYYLQILELHELDLSISGELNHLAKVL